MRTRAQCPPPPFIHTQALHNDARNVSIGSLSYSEYTHAPRPLNNAPCPLKNAPRPLNNQFLQP